VELAEVVRTGTPVEAAAVVVSRFGTIAQQVDHDGWFRPAVPQDDEGMVANQRTHRITERPRHPAGFVFQVLV
jgi:hypothetical protein